MGILNYIEKQNILKIKDKTNIEINLENLAAQNNLKGIFVNILLEKIRKEPQNRKKIEKAIEIGLSAFD